jgi:hypothetical protein
VNRKLEEQIFSQADTINLFPVHFITPFVEGDNTVPNHAKKIVTSMVDADGKARYSLAMLSIVGTIAFMI